MGWNEPGGGKDPWDRPPGGGQPEFDAFLNRLRQRLGGGSSGGPRSLAVLALAAVSFWLATGIYIVEPTERAVVLQLGRYHGMTERGAHWHLPYPIQSITKVNVGQIQTFADKGTLLTQDQNLLALGWVVEYRITDAKRYFFSTRNPEESIREAAHSALRDAVGTSKVDDVYYDGRAMVADSAQAGLRQILDSYGAGIEVAALKLQDVHAPEPVMAAFAEVDKARDESKAKLYEAQAYANTVLPKAQGDAAKQVEEAEGYRARVTERAKGDAARFLALLAEYQKAPQVTRRRLYLDAMESILGRTTKLVVDSRAGGPTIYLPIDQLMKQSEPAAATPVKPDSATPDTGAPAAAKPDQKQAAPAVDYRSRDRGRTQ